MSRAAPVLCVLYLCSALSCVSQSRAEEYYALGMAYYDLGKYPEAESWLARSKLNDKTKMASLYQLGRISFNRGQYEDAIVYFNAVLAKDPQNVKALKAAAYSYVKSGNVPGALAAYEKAARLIPDSGEEQYNYALLLAAAGRNAEAEEVITRLGRHTGDNALLLLARTQKHQKKPEAIDNYKAVLLKKNEPQIRFEYAETLEERQLYARALQEYTTLDETFPDKALILFRKARVLIISDPANTDGMKTLEEALRSGYKDEKEINTLLETASVPAAKRTELKALMN